MSTETTEEVNTEANIEEERRLWERFSGLYEKREGFRPHPRDVHHKFHFEMFKMGWEAKEYCAHCDDFTGHSTSNCVLPIVAG